jgi:glutamate-5-semialdehyde dehydrogenase
MFMVNSIVETEKIILKTFMQSSQKMSNPLLALGTKARAAALQLAQTSTARKNAALAAIAENLRAEQARILAANEQDIATAKKYGMEKAMLDRLRLDEARLGGIIESLKTVAALPDPVDRLLETIMRPNGLRIEKRAVPIGVIGIIFESRPNVAMDAAALCIKSGNACILRGGSESWHSVSTLIEMIRAALDKSGLPADAVQNLPSADRELVGALLTLDDDVDLIIPRGGKSLITRVRAESHIPVLSQLEGICHTYIDASADAAKAVAVTLNAKMRRTSICGATECLVLHRDIAASIGKDVITALLKAGCEVRAPKELLHLNPALKPANTSDYGHEFLAPVIAVVLVDDVKEAVDFINAHNSQHTDAIVTEDKSAADYFLRHVTSAIAMHNASTQFADGGEFGKGTEIGIATGKLHARGPVGLEELTTYHYRVYGNGQVRGT